MAYMRQIIRMCSTDGCTNRAILEVVDRRNASHGVYCSKHAYERWRHLGTKEMEGLTTQDVVPDEPVKTQDVEVAGANE